MNASYKLGFATGAFSVGLGLALATVATLGGFV